MKLMATLIAGVFLLAGCTSDVTQSDDADSPDLGVGPGGSNETSDPATIVAAVSGAYELEIRSGMSSTSFNHCRQGTDEFELGEGIAALVVEFWWSPAESPLELALDSPGGRTPTRHDELGDGTLRATYTDPDGMPPGMYTIDAVPGEGVTAQTTYHLVTASVPDGIDASSVQPTDMANAPGGC